VFSATAIGTAAAVVAALTPFVLRWLDRRRMGRPSARMLKPTERSILIQRVRHAWIAGVLEPSLANTAKLTLGLKHRPDLLDNAHPARQRPAQPAQLLPDCRPISEIFDAAGGGLLILGESGAGKTTLLLTLARELLERAENDPGRPIPVVINLASWGRQRQPLNGWLAEEVALGYNVPRFAAREWIQADALLPLLDGLDEVAPDHRVACVEAINVFRSEHGLAPMAVCCRTQELAVLPRMEEAVELQPPSDAEIDNYLGHLPPAATAPTSAPATVSADPQLRDLFGSPLMLHVLALVYSGRPAPDLHIAGSLPDPQERLWAVYVQRMFDQRPLPAGCGYTSQEAVSWLRWLATRLRERDQVEFHLDRLDLGLLATPLQRGLTRAVAMLFAAILAAMIGYLGWVPYALDHPLAGPQLLAPLVICLAAAAVVGRPGAAFPAETMRWSARRLTVGLVIGLAGGLLGPVFWWGRRSPRDCVPFQAFCSLEGSTPWSAMAGGLSAGLIVGFASRLLAGSAPDPTAATVRGWRPTTRLVLGAGLGIAGGFTSGAQAGAVETLLFALFYCVSFGLMWAPGRGLRDTRLTPNEGIRRSVRYGLVGALVVWLGLTLLVFAAVSRDYPTPRELWQDPQWVGSLGVLLEFALVFGLLFGGDAVVRHYAIRAALAFTGSAPLKWPQFLDAMTQRLLLRRIGSGYLFAHRLLRDHFSRAKAAA
jgi:hypothetical protein